jgi:hypothetical protein
MSTVVLCCHALTMDVVRTALSGPGNHAGYFERRRADMLCLISKTTTRENIYSYKAQNTQYHGAFQDCLYN